MKFYLGILFLLITCFVASPTSAVRACGDAGVGQGQVKAVSQADDDHCAPLGDDCVDTHPGQNCPPDTDGCGHCHCPGCGATGMSNASFFKNTFAEISAPDWLYDGRAANFCYQAPRTSAHLTILFQPPQV